jgi:lipopolysaccharide export system permease protein
MKLTLYKCVSNEIWPTFLVCMFVSVFIILATKMLSITELIVNRGGDAAQVGKMVLFLVPDIITFILPAATLMAVVVAFLRLSADNEIIALKSCGVSLYQMLPPVVMISFLGLLIGLFTGLFAVPWGNVSFKNLVFQMAESQADLGIKERIFSEPFNDVVFYVNSFSERDRLMKDVFVVDSRNKDVTNTIIAKEGRIFLHPKERIITIQFVDGSIFVVEKQLRSARTIKFSTYDLDISLKDIMAALASRQKKPKEMSLSELVGQLGKERKDKEKKEAILIELYEKFSIPLAVFLMGIIGVPLGTQMRSRGRGAGIGVSLAVFLIFYLCLGSVRSLSQTATVNPIMLAWVPDLFLLLACIYLLRRVARERPIKLLPDFLMRGGIPQA